MWNVLSAENEPDMRYLPNVQIIETWLTPFRWGRNGGKAALCFCNIPLIDIEISCSAAAVVTRFILVEEVKKKKKFIIEVKVCEASSTPTPTLKRNTRDN